MTEHLRFNLEVPAGPEYAGTARLFAGVVARQLGCGDDAVEDLRLAVTEMLAVKLDADGGRNSSAAITLRPDGTDVLVTICDGGQGFEHLVTTPNAGGPGARAVPGGDLSSVIVSALFPDVQVDQVDGQTHVILRVPCGD